MKPCAGKSVLPDLGLARAVARRMARAGSAKKQARVRPYRCRYCGRLHLGSDYVATRAGREERRKTAGRREEEEAYE